MKYILLEASLDEAVDLLRGKTIQDIKMDEKQIIFFFAAGIRLTITDTGQNCCEWRYMHTDDDIDYYIGSDFLGAHVVEGPTEDDDYDVKESEFLIIRTSGGEFTVVNYNEHNGYYGGFSITATISKDV